MNNKMLSIRTAFAASALASAAGAQAACKVSANDAWVKKQAEWFDDTKGGWSNDGLRAKLIEAAGLSPQLKMPVSNGVEVAGRAPALGATAGAMIDSLKKLAAVRGAEWPTKSVVGAAGVHAVYLLTLGDTGLARASLHRMMEAGPAESPAIDVAMFEDHMRLIWGRKQLYGTQFQIENGKVVLSPMEDSAHADLRREDAWLPPFKTGMCIARSVKP